MIKSFYKFLDKFLIIKLAIFLCFFYISIKIALFIQGYFQAFSAFFINFCTSQANHPFIKFIIKHTLDSTSLMLSFIPIVSTIFVSIQIIEASDIIPRFTKKAGKTLSFFGLSTDSILPLISGATCSVPAYLATRTIKDAKKRFITMLAVSFIPCSAKITTFAILSSILFPQGTGVIILLIYLAGVFFALVSSGLTNKLYKGDTSNQDNSNYLEFQAFKRKIPPREILKSSIRQVKSYIKNIGVVILFFSLILSILSGLGINKNGIFITNEISHSLTGQIGIFLEPLFLPLGFDYRLVISLISAFIAKEMAISSLIVMLHGSEGLKSLHVSSIASYIVFLFFYMPCISATVTFAKEAGKKYAFILFAVTSALAYFCAMLTYQLLK